MMIGFSTIITAMQELWGKSKAFWPLIIGGTLFLIFGFGGVCYEMYTTDFVGKRIGTTPAPKEPVSDTTDADTIAKLLELKKIIDVCQAERALYKTVFEQCRASKVIPKDRIAQMCGMINEDSKIKKILYLPNFKGSNLSNAQFDEGVCREGSIGPYCEIGE